MVRSDQTVSIPAIDLLTWTFGNEGYNEDKPLYIDAHDPSKTISRREAKVYVRSMIAGLQAYGLEPGDSVCLHSFNNIYYSLVYLAIIGARGRFVGSNPAHTGVELRHLMKILNVKFFIVHEELMKSFLCSAAATEHGLPTSRIFLFRPYSPEDTPVPGEAPVDPEAAKLPDKAPVDSEDAELPDEASGVLPNWLSMFRTTNELLDYGQKDWHTFKSESESRSEIAAVMSTSGTTGRPKAAAISHYALVAQCKLLQESKEKPYQITRLLCLSQFHAFACPLYLAPLREGHTTYIMKKFDINQFTEYIPRYSITETTVVTPIVMALLDMPSLEGLPTLRFIWCGGARLDAGLQKRLMRILHPETIVAQVWGMTEMGWITTFQYPEKDDTGSVGKLLPNMEAKIKRSFIQKTVKRENVAGEILVRGPSMMAFYFDDTEATRSTIINGWLHTGDIGYQKYGKWYLMDRVNELIKVRGREVSPTELEKCLTEHEDIVDAAVIGVDFQDGRGELPRAYVVVKQDAPAAFTDAQIQHIITSQLAKYKALAGGVIRVESIERSCNGKILKHLLRTQAKLQIMNDKKANNELAEKEGKEKRKSSTLGRSFGRLTLRSRRKDILKKLKGEDESDQS